MDHLDEVGTYIGYPAIIGKDGIEEVPAIELTKAEEQKLQDSASIIKKHIIQLTKKEVLIPLFLFLLN